MAEINMYEVDRSIAACIAIELFGIQDYLSVTPKEAVGWLADQLKEAGASEINKIRSAIGAVRRESESEAAKCEVLLGRLEEVDSMMQEAQRISRQENIATFISFLSILTITLLGWLSCSDCPESEANLGKMFLGSLLHLISVYHILEKIDDLRGQRELMRENFYHR